MIIRQTTERKYVRRIIPVIALAVLLAASSSASAAWPVEPLHKPHSVDTFRDSEGVNVHMGYGGTGYRLRDSAGRLQVLDALDYLGIRNVRDGLCSTCQATWQPLQKELAAAGKRFDFLAASDFSSLAGHTPEQNIPYGVRTFGAAIKTFEDINEPDGQGAAFSISKLHSIDARERSLINQYAPGTPLVGPAFITGRNYGLYGNQSALIDRWNGHWYPGDGDPNNQVANRANSIKEGPAGGEVTETGYHDDTVYTGGHAPVSQAAAGIYMPRIFLSNFFLSGAERTYTYELVDEHCDPKLTASYQNHFGLEACDWTPKPAARAIHDLNAAIGTGHPGASTGLRFATSQPVTMYDGLLQRSIHGFVLVVWRNAAAWQQRVRNANGTWTPGHDLTASSKTQTITWGQQVYDQYGRRLGATTTVSVGAQPVVLQIRDAP